MPNDNEVALVSRFLFVVLVLLQSAVEFLYPDEESLPLDDNKEQPNATIV